jgi:hypothetical protein
MNSYTGTFTFYVWDRINAAIYERDLDELYRVSTRDGMEISRELEHIHGLTEEAKQTYFYMCETSCLTWCKVTATAYNGVMDDVLMTVYHAKPYHTVDLPETKELEAGWTPPGSFPGENSELFAQDGKFDIMCARFTDVHRNIVYPSDSDRAAFNACILPIVLVKKLDVRAVLL